MQKTTRLQRLLAVVVAVFMAVCCLPLNAFAATQARVPFQFRDAEGKNVGEVHDQMLDTYEDGGLKVKFTLSEIAAQIGIPEDYDFDTSNDQKDVVKTVTFEEGDWSKYRVGETIYLPLVKKPQWQDSKYEVNFVNQETGEIIESTKLNSSVLEGQDSYLLESLNTTIQSVLDEGYDLVKVELADGTPVDDRTVMVAGDNKVFVYVVPQKTEPEWQDAIYEVNFENQETGKIVKSTKLNSSVLEGQDSYLLESLNTTIQSVLDEGYDLVKVEFYDGTPVDANTVMAAGNHKLFVYVTEKVVEPQDREAVYTVNFVDENGNKIKDPVNVNMSWVDGQELFVLAQLESTLKSVEGYTFQNLTAYNGTEPYDGDELVVEGNYSLTAHYTKIDLDRDTTYKINFVDQNNNIIRDPAVVTIGWVDGQDLYVLAQLESTLNGVEGNYSFDKLTAWNGTEAISDTVKVVPGSYELTAHYILGGKDCNSKYTIHFVDENNNEFMDPAVVNMAWVEGQELNLMTQLKSTLDSVSAKGYTFKTLTAWNGTEAYKGDELVVPGEYELIAHCVKNTSDSTGGDNNSNNNNSNNNNTKTVSSNNNQVVKADAPADNTAKIMPQTGLSVETPVVFGVMMVAALAGAGAYLFAIRKKLN